MNKYAIWNKKDMIFTPIGEALGPEQWIERYPIAGVDSITVICAAGEINGAFFGTLGQMVDMYTKMGCDFDACITDEEKLAAIEAFENAREEAAKAAAAEAANAISTDERIAAALEAQVMMSMPDEEFE
jgi:hypothetical protein